MSDSVPLEQQVVLITGASSGIGAALARLLAQKFPGIRLVLAARSMEQLEQVATDCRQAGAQVLAVPTDMSSTEQVESLASSALEHFGRVDALINNAGYGQMGPVELISPADVRRQLEVNVVGPVTLIRALVPVMRDCGGGRIVNISSIAGRIAFPFGGVYSASKFALEALSDSLRMELAPFNIDAILIEPGPVSTNFFTVATQTSERAVPAPQTTPYSAAFKKLLETDKPTDRQAWSPERVAKVILQALTDRHPRPRYIAATGGNLLLCLMTKLLPVRTADAYWQRFYGIDRIVFDWRKRKKKPDSLRT